MERPDYLTTGARDGYSWLASSRHRLDDVLRACPEIVLGKTVLITSFDSGPLIPSAEEIAAGWTRTGSVARSPVVTDVASVPRDGWDEWYVFPDPGTPPDIEVFVNFGGFSLADPPNQAEADPTWCSAAEAAARDDRRKELDRFWRQLVAVGPESYIADGDRLNLATTDPGLFAKFSRAFDR